MKFILIVTTCWIGWGNDVKCINYQFKEFQTRVACEKMAGFLSGSYGAGLHRIGECIEEREN